MRGKITLAILDAIQETGSGMADVFGAFLSAGYGASLHRMEREVSHMRRARRRRQRWSDEENRLRHRYSNVICRLKRDGLIKSKSDGSFSITDLGRHKRDFFKKHIGVKLPPLSSYIRQADTRFVIVAFDVPEKERAKRDWLRSALRRIGLNKVQKSLWIGKCKVSENFLTDLENLKLLNYVEIFEVTKTGTLEHIV